MNIYEKIKELGYKLPVVPKKGGLYMPVKQVGNILYVSGQGPVLGDKPVYVGKVGDDRTLEEGQDAARICVLNALSCLDNYLGDLHRIKSVVKTLVFVASAPGFNLQPKVADGASELLANIFGEKAGIGSRSAISSNELPNNISVEIEFIFEING